MEVYYMWIDGYLQERWPEEYAYFTSAYFMDVITAGTYLYEAGEAWWNSDYFYLSNGYTIGYGTVAAFMLYDKWYPMTAVE